MKLDDLRSEETRREVDAALSLWEGGAILRLGLRRPAAAVALSRCGPAVLGFDPDPDRVRAAAALNGAGKGSASFVCGALAEIPRPEHGTERADVALIEELPEGARLTFVLEAALAAAKRVVIPSGGALRIPDRFRPQPMRPARAGTARGFLVLSEAAAEPSRAVRPRVVCGVGRARGEAAADAGCARAAALAGVEREEAPVVAIVRDHGFEAAELDAAALAFREADRAASIAAVATAVDRFSAEHLESLATFDRIWVPCGSQRARLIASGAAPERVRVFPDVVDTDLFRPRLKALTDFRVLAMASTPLRIGEALVAAEVFSEELGREETASLEILCGPEVDASALTAAIDPRARARIRVEDAVPHREMARRYARFDLFLRPSRGERRGLAILEAMACGVAVAATRFGIAAELVRPETGYPVEPERFETVDPTSSDARPDEAGALRPVPDRASLRRALREAFDDRRALRARGQAARDLAVAEHSPEAAAARAAWPAELRVPQAPEPSSAVAGARSLAEAARELGARVLLDSGARLAPTPEEMGVAAKAEQIWCTSRLAAQAWIDAGIDERRVFVALAAVDLELFRPAARPAVLPTRARIRVLADGSRDLTGGLDLAVRAFAAADLREAALLVRGASAATRKTAEDLARALSDRIELVFVSEPETGPARASLVAACDLFLDLSRNGSDGRALLEAAACGKPSVVVATAAPDGFPGGGGFEVPARLRVLPVALESFASLPIVAEADVEEAAARIVEAAADPATRKRRGERARELALAYGPGALAEWIEARRRGLSEGAPSDLAVIAPTGAALPPLPEGTEVIRVTGVPERGGFGVEIVRALGRVRSELVLVATGGFEARGEWLRAMRTPLEEHANVAATIARAPGGALLAARPRRLRRLRSSGGFATPAALLDLVRELVRVAAPVVSLRSCALRFESPAAAFAIEEEAAEALAAAQDAVAAAQPEAALDGVRRALESLPGYVAAHEFAAALLQGLGKPEGALEARRAVARLDARDPWAQVGLARALLARGDVESGTARLRAAHRLLPLDGRIAFEYGSALALAGKPTEAADLLLTAVSLDPENAEAAAKAVEVLSAVGAEAASAP